MHCCFVAVFWKLRHIEVMKSIALDSSRLLNDLISFSLAVLWYHSTQYIVFVYVLSITETTRNLEMSTSRPSILMAQDLADTQVESDIWSVFVYKSVVLFLCVMHFGDRGAWKV